MRYFRGRVLALISVAALTSFVGAPVFAAPTSPVMISPSDTLNQIQQIIASEATVEFEPGNYSVGNIAVSKVANATETISFAAGTYSGLSFTVGAQGITFEPAGANGSSTFSGESGPVFTIESGGLGATITGLTFTNITDPSDSGVITVPGTGASDVTVSNNMFTNSADTAIGYHGNDNTHGTGWTISGNRVSDLAGGTALSGPSGIWLGNLAGSQITDNVIQHTGWAGIVLTGGPGTPNGTTSVSIAQMDSNNTNNVVSGNTITNVPREGIQVGFGDRITVENNQVSQAGTTKSGSTGQNGAISLFNADQTSILIEDNRLLDSYRGITIGQAGVFEASLGTVTIFGNTIENSVSTGIANYSRTGAVDAKENWWGSGIDPASAGAVTTIPCLSSVKVSLSNDASGPYAQAAVTDSAGATQTTEPFSIDYHVYPKGSNSLIASGLISYGHPFDLPKSLGVGTYTITASAAIAGIPSARLAGSADLTVASAPSTPPAVPPATRAQGLVTPHQGATVSVQSSNGTTLNVAVPSSAFSMPVELTMNAASTIPSGVANLPNLLQVLTVTATTSGGVSESYPAKPVTLTFQLPSPPSGLVTVQFWNALLGEWQPLPGVSVNGTTVSVSVSHFTTFALVPATSVSEVERLGGATRMDTAIQAAEAAYPDGASSVVLANAGSGAPSPDALAAAGLAGALNAPSLLNPANALDPNVKTALTTMGVKTVYVVGGPVAISNAVVTSLQNMGITVVRDFEGATRFQTAELIDEYLYEHNLTTSKTLFVVNGATMIDALSASPVAYKQKGPMPLVNTGDTSIPSPIVSAMQEAGITNVAILGETAAVSSAIQTQLSAAFGTNSVIRLGGADRNQTAIAIDQHFFRNPHGIIVAANGAGGGSFVDALSASALASMNDVAIVLSSPSGLPTSTQGYLKSVSLQAGWIMGGTEALSGNVTSQIRRNLTLQTKGR